MSQKDVADVWSAKWPENSKTFKNISYWELWPSKTGYKPSLEVLGHLAEIYECSVSDLLSDVGTYSSNVGPTLVDSLEECDEENAVEKWQTVSVRALLRLDLDSVEMYEERCIVATRELSVVDTSISVPRHVEDALVPHGIDVSLLFGGELVVVKRSSESQFRYVVDLAAPIPPGGTHVYAIRVRIPRGQMMAPHFVQIPLRKTESFTLWVRFGRDRVPERIWKLDGLPPASVYEKVSPGEVVVPDRLGDLSLHFQNVRVGHTYGIRWSEPG
ncbi:hypothetical protein SK803_04085 [Lentzea sp. BCCO 10_0856]|uniref:HTH cro/C1-type domain-containing protein n=1 Tax=Lentzea miocenica TaxID=3095431 RepID=A0ABU4STY1_9PSEU|nr:hypothetical protein [Lentzea sp. BCCO 10_0856]MDX8029373.1 hypothetical protein [Lentzea sp. BCCO 10_0856]